MISEAAAESYILFGFDTSNAGQHICCNVEILGSNNAVVPCQNKIILKNFSVLL